MKELTKETLKEYLQNYIDKWNDMIQVSASLNLPPEEQKIVDSLNIKIETFKYLIGNGIDENFE